MSEKTQPVEQFLSYTISNLLDTGSVHEVKVEEDEIGVIARIYVAEDQMGKLIGRNGQTISALRLLVRSIGARIGTKATLKVVEPTDKTEV